MNTEPEKKNWLVIRQFVRRNKILRDAGFRSYADFLADPLWKKVHQIWRCKRSKGGPHWNQCYCCGAKDRLQLHHMKYQKLLNARLGTNIVPVCDRCQQTIHALTRTHPTWSIRAATKKLRKMIHKNGSQKNRVAKQPCAELVMLC